MNVIIYTQGAVVAMAGDGINFGILLSHVMSFSSVSVIMNALRLKRMVLIK